MSAYYNENDKKAAAWLRELIKGGHIAPGEVDERSIEDVAADDLVGFAQCHFFAGVGVWSYALRRAGWADDRPVWTGSCPCQPFSVAGDKRAFSDERHLWPAFFRLIRQRRPGVVFGEQVASKDALDWIDHVSADMEREGYAVGPLDLCAAGFGAPHIRQRLFWVADAHGERLPGLGLHLLAGESRDAIPQAARRSEANGLVNVLGSRLEGHGGHGDDGHEPGRLDTIAAGSTRPASGSSGLGDMPSGGRGEFGDALVAGEGGHPDGAVDAPRRVADAADGDGRRGECGAEAGARANGERRRGSPGGGADSDGGPTNGFWRAADWLFCRDGKWRPVEPGTFPLATGAPARVGRLRGYGNSINAEVAQEFVAAYMSL